MNIFEKGLVGIRRIFDSDFNNYIDTLNKAEGVDLSGTGSRSSYINSIWDSYPSTVLNVNDYVTGNAGDSPKERKKKNISKRKIYSLTYDQMWDFYIANSLLRACIDTKTKQIASLEWEVLKEDVPYLNQKNISKEDIIKKKKLEKILYNPNELDESFQTLVSKVLTDLLLFDAGVMRILYNKETKAPEKLIALNARHIRYILNAKKEPIGFHNKETDEIYTENEIIYLKLYPNTDTNYGTPPIESIIPEITGDILSIIYNNKYFSENEIPDGLLYLGDIDGINYEKIKSGFRQYKAKQYAIRMIAGKTEPKWINFKASNRDMQFAELQDRMRKRIMTVYQINDTELGYTSDINKSGGETQREIFSSKGLKPLITLLEYHINTEFIQKIHPDFYFQFVRREMLKEDEQYKQLVVQSDLMQIQLFNLLVQDGKITLNEYRTLVNSLPTINQIMQLKTVDFGDQHIVASHSNSNLKYVLESNKKELINKTPEQHLDEVKGQTNSSNLGMPEFENLINNLSSDNSNKKDPDTQKFVNDETEKIRLKQRSNNSLNTNLQTNAEDKQFEGKRVPKLPQPDIGSAKISIKRAKSENKRT